MKSCHNYNLEKKYKYFFQVKKAVMMFDQNSKLACHVQERHHRMDFENVQIVGMRHITNSCFFQKLGCL